MSSAISAGPRTRKFLWRGSLDKDSWRYRRMIERSQERYYIYMPRRGTIALLVLMFLALALVIVPPIAQTRAAVYRLSWLAVLELLPATILLCSVIARGAVDEIVDGTHYWLTKDEFNTPIMITSAAAAVATAVGLGLASAAYYRCTPNTYASVPSLAAFVAGVDATPAPADLPALLAVSRQAQVDYELALFSLCLDDRLLTWTTLVANSVLIVLNVATIIVATEMRKRSIQFEIDFAEVGEGTDVMDGEDAEDDDNNGAQPLSPLAIRAH